MVDALKPCRGLRHVWHRITWSVMVRLHCARTDRLDHEPMYLWIHSGLVLVGLGLAIQPKVTNSALAGLSRDFDRGLALIIFAGSGCCLLGACMGFKWFFPDAKVDVRLPYMAAAFGQVSVVTSLTIFVVIIVEHSDLIGTLSGALSIAIMFACAQIAGMAIKETWRFQHMLNHPDCHWFDAARQDESLPC